MPQHRHRTLYRSTTVAVSDVCCRASRDDDDARKEERSGRHEVVFTRGGVFLKHVAGREVVADCTSVVFFNAGEPYRVTHPVAGGDDCTVLSFSHEVLRDAIAGHDPRVEDRPAAPFAHAHAPSRPAELLRQHVIRAIARGGGELDIDERAVGLLESVLRGSYSVRGEHQTRRRASTARAHRETARDAQALLNAHFAEPMDLAQVARRVHASPFHLARLFRRETGRSIHEYRTRLRLGAALQRLADGAGDLTALALELGFSSHAHFTDAFRQMFDTSPSDFRRTARRASLREMSTKLKA